MANTKKQSTTKQAEESAKKTTSAVESKSEKAKQERELNKLMSAAFGENRDAFQGFIGLTQKLKQKQEEIDLMARDTLVASILSDYLSDTLLPNSNGDLVQIVSKNMNHQSILESIYRRLNIPLDKVVYSLLKNAIVIAEFEQVQEVDLAKQVIRSEKSATEQTATEATFIRKPGTILPNISIISDAYTVFPIIRYERCIGYIQVKKEARLTDDFDWQSQTLDYTDVIIHQSLDYTYEIYGVRHDSIPLTLSVKDADGAIKTYDVASGCSMLEDSYSAWKTLSLLEDSVVLASLIKNAQIMLVETEAGNATEAQIEAAKIKLRGLFEGQLAMGNNGLKSYLNPQAKPAYIYSFTNNGVGKITASIIGGEYNPGQLYYLTPFVNQFFSGMNYPKQNAGFTEGAGGLDGGGAVEQYTKRYQSTVARLKRLLASFIKKCVNNVLLSKGLYNIVDNFEVKVYGAYQEEGTQEVQLQQAKLQLFESLISFSGLEDPEKQKELRSILIKQVITTKEVVEEIDRLLMDSRAQSEPQTSQDGIELGQDTQLPEGLDADLGLGATSEEPQVPEELPDMKEVLDNNG